MRGDVFAEGDRVEMIFNPGKHAPRGVVLATYGRSLWVLFDDTRPVLIGQPDTRAPESWGVHMFRRPTVCPVCGSDDVNTFIITEGDREHDVCNACGYDSAERKIRRL